MADDPDKGLREEMDHVLEALRANAKRRGLDVEGKSMEEISKLLLDLEARESQK